MLVSGGRDSVCLLDVLASICGARSPGARFTSTTDCAARSQTATSFTCASCASDSASPPRCDGAGGAAARQPAGLGARPALRARDRDRRLRRADRDRPHRLRPGRDGALPPRRLARPPRAARHGPARGPPGAPAAAPHARADRSALPRPRPRLARRQLQRRPRSLRARAGAPPRCCRRCAPFTPPPSATCCAASSCCAPRPRCSTRSSPSPSPGASGSR